MREVNKNKEKIRLEFMQTPEFCHRYSWGIGISFKDVDIPLIAAWNSSEMLLSALLA